MTEAQLIHEGWVTWHARWDHAGKWQEAKRVYARTYGLTTEQIRCCPGKVSEEIDVLMMQGVRSEMSKLLRRPNCA